MANGQKVELFPGLPAQKPQKPKPVAKKPKAAAKPIGRPAPLVALHERYGLVYEPGQEADPLVKDELDALNELYRQRVGRELADEQDTRVALEQAGFLKPTVSRKRATELGREAGDVFASALDALDAIGKELVTPARARGIARVIAPGFAPLVESPEAAKLVERVVRSPLVGGPAIAAAESGRVGDAIGGLAQIGPGAVTLPATAALVREGPVRDFIGEAAKGPLVGGPLIAAAQSGKVGKALFNLARIGPGAVTFPVSRLPTREEIANLPAGPQIGIGGFTPEAREKVNMIAQAGPVSLYTVPGKTVTEEMLGTGEARVSDAQAQKVSDELFAGQRDNDRLVKVGYLAQAAYDGLAASDIEAQQKQLQLGPLASWEREILVKYARDLGHDIANPSDYTDADLFRKAFSIPSPSGEVARGLVRQTAEFSSLPAGMLAIGKELASGDPNRILGVVEQALQPYAYVKDDAAKRGWDAALSSFAQERPVDALLVFSAITRGTGRTLGATARTVGGTGASLPQLLLRSRWMPKQGGVLARVGEAARAEKPIVVQTGRVPGKRTVEGEVVKSPDVEAEYVIGYTTPNLFSSLAAQGRAYMLSRTIQRGGTLGDLAGRSAARRAKRSVRRIKNRSDDAAARVALQLQELSIGLNRQQLTRLALELTSAMVRPTQLGGGRYTFADRAEHWRERAQVQRDLADAAARGETVLPDGTKVNKRATDYRKNAILFERQARFFDDVARTPLDEATIQQAREAVREIGDDNDTIVAMIIESMGILDDPRGLERSVVRSTDLRPGDRIDISRGEGDVRPANVLSVTRLGDGRVSVEYRDIVDPTRPGTLDFGPLDRVTTLRPGVNQAKYVRQWLEWESSLRAIAEDIVAARNQLGRADVAGYNAAVRRLRVLDARRGRIGEKIAQLIDDTNAARAAGDLARVRRLRKSYEVQVRRLLLTLREMEKQATDAGLDDLARQLREARSEVVLTRGIDGRAPFAAGRVIEELPADDVVAARQARVIRTVESGEVPPLRAVEQPEAAARLERATGLRRRADELEVLQRELEAEAAGAPTAAQAGRARRELGVVEEDVTRLVGQSAEARASTADFRAVFDDLGERLRFLESRTPWLGDVSRARTRIGKARRTFLQITLEDRAEARRVLRGLQEKLDSGAALTEADVRLLEQAEALVIRSENRAKRYKQFDQRVLVRGRSRFFGQKRVRSEVTPPRERGREVLGEARRREQRADALIERIRARETAPSAFDIRQVRKQVKELRREADKEQRAAKRIIERGRPLVAGRNMYAALDASGSKIAFQVGTKDPVRFTMNQVMGELQQEFIARAEMTGDDPVLWLGTRRGSFGLSSGFGSFQRGGKIDMGPTGGIPSPRFAPLRGDVTRAGLETTRNAWENLISDTSVIRGALEWQRQMRTFIGAVSIRIDDVTEAEAFKLNENMGRRDPDAADIEISEAESVVWDARNFVAIDLIEGKPVGRQKIDIGAVDDITDETLADLFLREAKATDLVKAGGSYLLVPRFLYDGIIDELGRINYRPGKVTQRADAITKQWRNFTLNILPRTGFANLLGSAALAILAGAGPKSFYLAYRHLKYGDVPAPIQLRQRYGMTMTSEADFAWLRDNIEWLDKPLGGLAWWMNNMRRFNGVSEDFGRLAVYYSKAYPAARRLAGDDYRSTIGQMRLLTDEMNDVLRAFANNDPDYAVVAERFTDTAFEFIGDLHQGGPVNTWLRIAFPFQQWYRHMLRLMLITMPLKYPGRTIVLQKIAEIGNEYLREHGVLAPYMADVVPIFVEEGIELGEMQEYIATYRMGPQNPFSTVSSAASGENFQFADYGLGALAPIWKNIFLLVMSLASGEAKQIGDNDLTKPALDVYGNTIKIGSEEGLKYSANLVFQMLPLSSTAVSSAGQAAEGNVLWGPAQRLLRGEEGILPVEALPPEAPGRDIVQVGGDIEDVVTGDVALREFQYANFTALMARLLLGGSFSYAIGKGPVQQSQFKAMMKNNEAAFTRQINNTLKTLEAQAGAAERAGRFEEAARIRAEAEAYAGQFANR